MSAQALSDSDAAERRYFYAERFSTRWSRGSRIVPMIGRAHLLYLHAQQDRAFCQELENHLSSLRQEGLLRDWGEGFLLGGDEIAAKLQAEIARADIVVILLSADFLAADRSQAQIDLVLAEREKRPVIIVPVVVRAVDWQRGRLGRFYALPRNGKPVAAWDRADDAWFDVAEGLHRLIQKDAAAPGCPFPGLEFFDEVQAPLFVGREREIREALSGLGQTADGYRRWLQIEGASGAGKSSFARAGLLPAVRRGEPKGAPSDWLVGVLRPGREPLSNMARALVDALAPVKLLDVAAVAAQLRAGGDALKDLLLAHAPPRRGLLLLVDQMEELFTLSEQQSTEVARMDVLLARALVAGDGVLHLLTTVRTDFLGHMSRLPELEATMNRASRYYLRPIKREQLRETLAGLAHRTEITWEGGLLDRLVADTGEEEGVLPLVGHVLRALWAKRVGNTLTNAAYETIQGVAGALSAEADGLLASFDATQQLRAQTLLLSLVKIGRGAADTRRVVLRPEAIQAAGGGPEADQILARLSGGRNPEAPPAAASTPRLVVVSGPAEQPSAQRVDLAHEAVLRRWSTLREWVEADRKMLERRDDLEAAALGWKEAGCPQEGLPGGKVLAYYQGAGLPHEQRQSLASLTNEIARRYLRQMEQNERRQRRRWMSPLAALGVLAVVLVLAVLYVRVQRRSLDTFCAHAPDRLPPLWSDARKREVHKALLATDHHVGATIWKHLAPMLDEYAHQWKKMNRESCQATLIRREQPAWLYELRNACLDRRYQEFSALTTMILTADKLTAQRAANAVGEFTPISVCADVVALNAPTPMTDAPQLREHIRDLYRSIEELQVFEHNGKYSEVVERARAVVQMAQTIGYAPALAEAQYLLARIVYNSGAYDQAEKAYIAAAAAAVQGHNTVLAAKAYSALAGLAGIRRRFADADIWEVLAKAELESGPGNPSTRVRLLLYSCQNAAARRQMTQAAAACQAAADLAKRQESGESIQQAVVLRGQANLNFQREYLEESLSLFDQSIRLLEKFYGPLHPLVAATLRDKALVFLVQDDYQQAKKTAERALDIDEHSFGSLHAELAESLMLLARIAVAQGDTRGAIVFAERALAGTRASLPDGHIKTAVTYSALGDVQYQAGRFSDALVNHRAALERLQSTRSHIRTVAATIGVAEDLLALGQAAQALPILEWGIHHQVLSDELSLSARRLFAWARTLWALGKKEPQGQAVKLARDARKEYVQLGRQAHRELAALDAWIASNKISLEGGDGAK